MSEIEETYLDPKKGFSSASEIHRRLKDADGKAKYSLAQVKEFLNDEETVQRHKRQQKTPFHITAHFVDHKWQADLVDVSSIMHQNSHFTFLLTVIDVLSKYAWVIPLKHKTDQEIYNGFIKIFSEGRIPVILQTDNGTEFKNKKMKSLTDAFGIDHQFNRAGDKQSQGVVERFNRTILSRIEKYKTANGTKRYLDVLDDLVENYNTSRHSTIDKSPLEALEDPPAPIDNSNVKEVLNEEKEKRKTDVGVPLFMISDFKVGDRVRRIINKGQFEKGYKPNWTARVYTIDGMSGHYFSLKGDDRMWKANELMKVYHEADKDAPKEQKDPEIEKEKEKEIPIPRTPSTRKPRVDYVTLAGKKK